MISTPGRDWLTIVAFLTSIGVAAKALLVSDGIIWDEKATVVLMLALAAGLNVWSVVVNIRRSNAGGILANLLSLFLLAFGFILAAHGWR
ncbi:MAG TPA: hypothetical protein VGR35_01335 [Tepidisphaeraceae bacterium]|nr:hypothetical protein [Tepidisphaeraceae bacterium]